MVELNTDYADKGIRFSFVNASEDETFDDIMATKKKVYYRFRILKDSANLVSDQFGATTAPEVFVLDSLGTVRYRGAIDDAEDQRTVKAEYVRTAIEAVFDGKTPNPATSKALGCPISRNRPTTTKPTTKQAAKPTTKP